MTANQTNTPRQRLSKAARAVVAGLEAAEPAPCQTPDARRQMMDEARAAQERLGVVWVREHGSKKYGKAKFSEVTDAQLATIHAAATAALAALDA